MKCKCDCCPCCHQWSSIEERVARAYIREQAETLVCGQLWSKCALCYDRRCVKSSYIIFTVLVVAALFMNSVGVMGVLPYIRTGDFGEGTCALVSVAETSQTYKCGREKCPENILCDKYRCLHLTVLLRTTGDVNTTTRLYDTQEELYGRGDSKECAIQLQGCTSSTNTEIILSQFLSTMENSSFLCLYNPTDLSQVVRQRTKPRVFSIVILTATFLLALFSLVCFLVTCLSCGCNCKVLCSGSPPRVIQDKLSVHRGNPRNSQSLERY